MVFTTDNQKVLLDVWSEIVQSKIQKKWFNFNKGGAL